MKTITKGPFLGLNNRLPEFSLHRDKVGDFLSEAENIDISTSGDIMLRNAASLIQPLSNAHSLYTTLSGIRYLVIGNALYVVTLPAYTQTLFMVLSNSDPVSYAEYNGYVFWSNGTDSGKIKAGVNYPWALPTPTAPVVNPIAGALYKGKYQVSVAHLNNVSGEEGGVSPATSYELAADGGLRVTIPASVTGGTHINVFVSTVNGSVPMLAKTVAAGTATVDITLQSELSVGRPEIQRYEAPIPAGRPFEFKGILYTVKGNNIYEGVPYRPGYYQPMTNDDQGGRIPMPSAVTNFVPAENGVYVVTQYVDEDNQGKTYWFSGACMTKAERVAEILPYGGVPSTEFKFPTEKKFGWFGALGIVIADSNGLAECKMSDNVDIDVPVSGCSAMFADGGYFRVVSCGFCLNIENGAVTTYSDYEFTSISGSYGTKAGGIYNLLATGVVPYVIGLGKENFGTEQVKGLPAVYLGVNSDSPMQLRVRLPAGEEYVYPARSSGGGMKIHRVDPGLGLRSNWYDLALIGEADFTLATMSFAPAASSRRI